MLAISEGAASGVVFHESFGLTGVLDTFLDSG